ncbi:ferredoxin reductase family protein [Hoeflea sp. AS60]|uniref:ferredoxin reductase family protein n=1 Tax=Hoeflea sp. AS60 TaxID=3135780 RepID=UPI00316E1FC7
MRFRRLIPAIHFLAFLTFHYLLVLGHVPPENQVPATLGASSLTAMTFAMVLAARFRAVDWFLDGPGRSYRLHRWLGYAAMAPMVGHWILATPSGDGIVPGLASSATVSAEYAAVLLVMLAVISPLKLVPYHLWKFGHFLMGPVYLIAVYHTFFARMPIATGDTVWWVLLALSLLGTLSLIRTVVRHVRPARTYVVSEIIRIKQGLDIRLRPIAARDEISWLPGQFASVSVEGAGRWETHPFTICSAPGKAEMRFVIGNRGDYTADLVSHLKPGDRFRIHEVNGEFTPQFAPDRTAAQVWVAGGIGLTPFLAAIDAMVPDNGAAIDLVYCYRSLTWAFDVERLVKAAETLPQLRVHFFDGELAGLFQKNTLPSLCAPGWKQGDLYICGPEPLIDPVCDCWRFHGGEGSIHVELFEFRTSWEVSRLLGKPRPNIDGGADLAPPAILSFGDLAEQPVSAPRRRRGPSVRAWLETRQKIVHE